MLIFVQGLECFRQLVNDPHFKDIPMILETPGSIVQFMNLDLAYISLSDTEPFEDQIQLLYSIIK